MLAVKGLGASEGIAIGRAVCIENRMAEVYRIPLPPEGVEPEIERYRQAVERARDDIRQTHGRVGELLGDELAGIFEAHALMLEDEAFHQRVEQSIHTEGVNAEWAVSEVIRQLEEKFSSIETPHLRERAEDLKDVGRYLLRSLQGVSHHELSEIEGEIVVIADDLTPSDAVRLGRQGVVGFGIETGGKTSHTAIIAHSLNIPLVTGLPGVTRLANANDLVVVDGTRGALILHPSPALLDQYRSRQRELQVEETRLAATRELPALSRDGVAVNLQANIDLVEEMTDAVRLGARGVGLFRSEFLYIERSPELPSEEEQLEAYRLVLEKASPDPVVVRTYDLGGRKLAREVMDTREENPVLGLRGIRLTLARPAIFRTQLRALYRAAACGDLRVLLPLVTSVGEVERFRAFAADVVSELDGEGLAHGKAVPLGVMIEVPAAALIADHLARHVDFFAIGTNDLIQYALAVDRNNGHVADIYQPLHPAILRMIRSVIEAAEVGGIDVSVCGEMAADPTGATMLLALGVRSLSMRPRTVPHIKELIRSLSMRELAAEAGSWLNYEKAQDVERALVAWLERQGDGAGGRGAGRPADEVSR